MSNALTIALDDLRGAEIAAFLDAHLADMRAISPPESKHALDLDGLRQPDIQFWTLRTGTTIAGCGALKRLDAQHAEITSMRTGAAFRGQGIGARMLRHLLDQARRGGYDRVSLETGSMPFFAPARRLYARFGFAPCPPFGSYRADPNSVFMTRVLDRDRTPELDRSGTHET